MIESATEEIATAFAMPPLLPVLPCARCGNMGWIPKPDKPPKRYIGKRFGIDGLICAGCYDKLRNERLKAERAANPNKSTQSERYQKKIERAVERYNTSPEELAARLEEMEKKKPIQGIYPKKSSIGDLSPPEACRIIMDMWNSGIAWMLTKDVDIEDTYI